MRKSPLQSRSDRLLKVLAGYERLIVVTHDNPDPDAIAAGWALQVMIHKRLRKPVRLIGGGDIVRAENLQMVTLLEPPLELVTELEVSDLTAAILVDCGPDAGNHLLSSEAIRPVAVIDHHVSSAGGKRLPFRDIRPRVAAAASIAASYLREQDVRPGERLATALCYGIRTETRGCQVHHSRLDRSVLRWLAEYMNPGLMAEIESAPLTRDYFGDLARALANSVMFDDVAICLLPSAAGAEIVGEVADLLIRYESVRAVLCAAIVAGDVVVSVRTARGGPDASTLVRRALDGLGASGGHIHRAGGKIPAARVAQLGVTALETEITRRWLSACDVPDADPAPLVIRI